MATAVKVTTLDVLRTTLPAQSYVAILNQIVLTGTMPILDAHGRPTDQATPVTPQMRYDALKYMTDKLIPQAKATDVQSTPDLETIASRGQVIRSMSVKDLLALRDAAKARIAQEGLT